MDLFSNIFNNSFSPFDYPHDQQKSKDDTTNQDLSGLNPEVIFKQLALCDDLVIYTPWKETEFVFKGHITPQSIFKKMSALSPARTTLNKHCQDTQLERRHLFNERFDKVKSTNNRK